MARNGPRLSALPIVGYKIKITQRGGWEPVTAHWGRLARNRRLVHLDVLKRQKGFTLPHIAKTIRIPADQVISIRYLDEYGEIFTL